MRIQRSKAGFSLIELLTVIAVLGVVTTLGTRMFVWVSSEWNSTRAQVELSDQAMEIIDSFREDCNHILSSRLVQRGLAGASGEDRTKTYKSVPVALSMDSVSFPIQVNNVATGRVERNMVQYSVVQVEGVGQLHRVESGLDGEEIRSTVIAPDAGVLALSLSYGDGGVWRDTWAKKTLPDAIRVEVVLQDPDRPYEQIARQADIAIQVD